MTEINPRETKWPFIFTIEMAWMKAKPGKPAQYEFGVVIKRGDKPSLRFTLCRSYGNCRAGDRQIIFSEKGRVAFRPIAVDGEHARIEYLKPFERGGYWDMSPANRPEPFYCPGTLFVKTDRTEFAYP